MYHNFILKDCIVDEETRTSTAIIIYKGKEYIGISKCHPEDEMSKFTGCRYAEQRAEIKALKDEWKNKKSECEDCRKFVRSLETYKDFDKESKTAKCVYKKLNSLIREVNLLAEEISKREFNLRVSIRQRNYVDNKIQSKNG